MASNKTSFCSKAVVSNWAPLEMLYWCGNTFMYYLKTTVYAFLVSHLFEKYGVSPPRHFLRNVYLIFTAVAH